MLMLVHIILICFFNYFNVSFSFVIGSVLVQGEVSSGTLVAASAQPSAPSSPQSSMLLLQTQVNWIFYLIITTYISVKQNKVFWKFFYSPTTPLCAFRKNAPWIEVSHYIVIHLSHILLFNIAFCTINGVWFRKRCE